MKRLGHLFLLSIYLLAMYGCKESSKSEILLKADLDKAKVVTINPENITWLETNDSSVIYDISNITHLDDRLVVQSRSLWKIFSNDGHYIGELAHKGEAPEDFLWMGNIWNDDSLVYMYDYNLNKIQKYDSNGNYHGYDTIAGGPEEDFDTQPDEVYITKNDGVFYVNIFMGVPPFSHMFCHAPDIHSRPKVIKGRRRENGHTFYNRIFIDNDNH